jgi:hypothetical protein
MWFLVLPLAALGVVVLVRTRPRAIAHAEVPDAPSPTTALTDEDLVELGVATTDVLEWLGACEERLRITRSATVLRTDTSGADSSVCVDFKALETDFKLWLDGPSFMGPFPRLARSEAAEGPGKHLSKRSADSLEQSIIELAKSQL